MPKPSSGSNPFLEFKFLKCMALSLPNGQYFQVPVKMTARQVTVAEPVQIVTHAGLASASGRPHRPGETIHSNVVTEPTFDLDHIFRAELEDERPKLPKKIAGVSDEFHAKLCEIAYERAVQAKLANDTVRRLLRHYVEDGWLEILSDPFADGGDETVTIAAEIRRRAATESDDDGEIRPRRNVAAA